MHDKKLVKVIESVCELRIELTAQCLNVIREIQAEMANVKNEPATLFAMSTETFFCMFARLCFEFVLRNE